MEKPAYWLCAISTSSSAADHMSGRKTRSGGMAFSCPEMGGSTTCERWLVLKDAKSPQSSVFIPKSVSGTSLSKVSPS